MPNLKKLYEEYFPLVYNRVFFRLLHKSDTEDIVSMIFLKIARKLHTYDETKATLKSWIFTIVRNTVTDHFRTKKEFLSLDDEDNTYEPTVDFEEQYRQIKNESGRALYWALGKLDRRSREILALKYFEDLPNREIAARMSLNESTASTLHLRALVKLRSMLGGGFGLISLNMRQHMQVIPKAKNAG